MELFEILKKFKAVEPDAAYKETAKRAILATMPRERWSIGRAFAGIFETGVALALAAFFIMVIAGQFSNSSSVAPLQLSVINPTSLHAEAQAIDMQIELVKLSYQEATTTIQSTTQLAPHVKSKALFAATSTPASEATGTPATVSVDDALQALTQ